MSPRVLFASLLALACLLYSPPASAQLPASLTDVQIISVSGCVDVGAVTVNCSVATTTLLIRTAAGFPATTNWVSRPVYVAARLNDYAYFVTTAPWLNTADPSNSSVYVNVTAGGYFPQLTGQFLSVSFVPSPSATRPGSAAFAGFSYAFDGPPTLLSISGCDGSGAATLHCVPGSSLLELTGSGLLWLQSSIRTTVNIGSVSDTLYGGVQVLNDSYATLSLAGLYSRLLQPQHYAGVLLSFNLTSTTYNRQGVVQHSYTTNALQLSFVPLPPPKVKDWYATTQHATSLLKPRQPPAFALNASVRCLSTKCMCFRVITTCDDASGAPSTWRGCRPGVSILFVTGEYLVSPDNQHSFACSHPHDIVRVSHTASFVYCVRAGSTTCKRPLAVWCVPSTRRTASLSTLPSSYVPCPPLTTTRPPPTTSSCPTPLGSTSR